MGQKSKGEDEILIKFLLLVRIQPASLDVRLQPDLLEKGKKMDNVYELIFGIACLFLAGFILYGFYKIIMDG